MPENKTKLSFDDGSQTLVANGYEIRWYPNDLEFVERFLRFTQYAESDLQKSIEKMRESMSDIENYEAGTISAMGAEFNTELDKAFNSPVSGVFYGVNPLSPTPKGGLLYENFLDAIMPLIEESFNKFAESREKYTAGSKNRAARRAKK